MNDHQKVYKIASIFLHYPEREWLSSLTELKQEIKTINDPSVFVYLTTFIHYLETTDYANLCEQYVNTFDFHGVVSLNLTYNVFKDSRRREEKRRGTH